MKFLPQVAACALLLLAVVATPTSAAADGLVQGTVGAIGGSGVSGTLTISEKAGSTLLVLDLAGLSSGSKYVARLHAGTCALPSASAGLLGTLTADAGGKAQLLANEVTFSAAGIRGALKLDELADGEHLVSLSDTASMAQVACGEIPRTLPATTAPPIVVNLMPDSGAAGVRATATITLQQGRPMLLHIDADGLEPDTTYVAHVHSGTLLQPSASFGLLGDLHTDAAGHGMLQTSTFRVSSSGDQVDLASVDLADGQHLIDLHGPGLAQVARGVIPEVTHAGDALESTGIEQVDSLIAAVLRGDTGQLEARTQLSEVSCVAADDAANGQLVCSPEEAAGAAVPVLPLGTCDGSGWARDPQPVLEGFVQESWRLRAVLRGPVVTRSDADYALIFDPRPGSLILGLAADVRDGAVTAVEAGCRTPDEMMLDANGEPLPVVRAVQ